ncbi:MAG: nucleoside triphosphate pyrophosphohydrolase [Pseudomonadota bacterium]
MADDLALPSEISAMQKLLTMMAQLRHPQNGCEWDRVQNFASIAPYTIEESYEVADAIARDDMAALQDELGDLLFQVIFHARMAEEKNIFNFKDIATALYDKMTSRHPHIFADQPQDTQHQTARWEAIKAQERANKGATSALDGVALALPALMRAEKLQKRAARMGFDWPDISGPEAKVAEELAELREATTEAEKIDEAGDLLFAAVNLVRAHGIAPEDALRAANAKFERRFRAMEALSATQNRPFAERTLDEQESLWLQVKIQERGI